MANAKIGVIVMMLKKKFEADGIYATLRELRELGYRCIEISQVPMTPENVAEFKRACDDFGLEVCAMSAPLAANRVPPAQPDASPHPHQENLTDDFDKIVADCKALGCRFLRMGMLPVQYLKTRESLIEFAHLADEMSLRLQKEGIQYYYHTHHFELTRFGKDFALDIIRDNSKHIGFELDVHWIHRGGVDPAKFIANYTGRVKLLHLKDYRVALFDPTDPKGMDKMIQFAELGEGNLDFADIIPAGIKAGAEYLIIEQDATYGRDPLESLRISRDHLLSLGYGDCF